MTGRTNTNRSPVGSPPDKTRLEQHVIPYLGAKRLDEITVDDILGLIGELREKGLSGGSIRSMLTPLSRLFSHAVPRDVIAGNPISKLDRTERPGSWMRDQRVLNRDEIGRLLDAAPPQYRTLLATAVLSGLRQSELLALRRRDIDFAEELIHLRRALDRKGRDVPPKTRHSVRDVVLMPGLAEALQQHREHSRFNGPEDFVFASRVGTPVHRRNLWRQAFEPAFTAAGIERLRWHDLRHTFASLLIGGGANVVFVSRQLGPRLERRHSSRLCAPLRSRGAGPPDPRDTARNVRRGRHTGRGRA